MSEYQSVTFDLTEERPSREYVMRKLSGLMGSPGSDISELDVQITLVNGKGEESVRCCRGHPKPTPNGGFYVGGSMGKVYFPEAVTGDSPIDEFFPDDEFLAFSKPESFRSIKVSLA